MHAKFNASQARVLCDSGTCSHTAGIPEANLSEFDKTYLLRARFCVPPQAYGVRKISGGGLFWPHVPGKPVHELTAPGSPGSGGELLTG